MTAKGKFRVKFRVLTALATAFCVAGCATPTTFDTATGDYLSGRLAANLNDVAAAAEHYGKAVAANPGDEELVRQAFFYHLAAGEIDAAGEYARSLASGAGGDGLANIALAAIALKGGDLEGARARLSGDFKEPFTKSISFLARAWIDAESDGEAAGVKALDAGGADVFTGFNPTFKAILLEAAGSFDAAREAHELSAATFGGPVGREAYGAFLERRDAAAARSFYDGLYAEGGPSRRLAEAALERIDAGVATKAYTDVSAAEGTALALYLFAGNVLQQSAGEMQRAAEAGFKVEETPFNLPLALAQLAAYLDPALHDARRLSGSILNIYANYDAARASLSKVLPSSPHFEQAQIEIANTYLAEKRPNDAIAALKETIRRDAGANEARLALAGHYAELDRHEDAVKTAGDAIERLGEAPPADAWRLLVTRAASLIELDRFSEAEAELKRAVEIAPEEPVVLNYLGYSWVERGKNLDEAFTLIEKAVALRPQSGAIIDSLGWAHYQRGDYAAALPHLEKAASLEPADPTVTDHLGDVYWRLGREVEARFQWRRALELQPGGRARAAIEAKLQSGLVPEPKAQ